MDSQTALQMGLIAQSAIDIRMLSDALSKSYGTCHAQYWLGAVYAAVVLGTTVHMKACHLCPRPGNRTMGIKGS